MFCIHLFSDLQNCLLTPEDEGLGTDEEAFVCAPSRDSIQCQQAVMGRLGKSHRLMQAMEEFWVSNILELKNCIGKMEKQLTRLTGAPARRCATTITAAASPGQRGQTEEVKV